MGNLAAAALTGIEGVDGLFPQRLIQLFQRGRLLTAEENRGVTIPDDRIGVVLIQRLELRLRLQNEAGGDLPAADGRHELFQIRDLPDVCRLIDQAAHMHRQASFVLVIRLFTQQVE